jgi:uncharacterized protein (TIGR00288 family)
MSGPETLHAALLIDFDNVTMGMRSDLSKELKNLLDSDVIKGKVSVQRAYADWRRYPQYIVPLSEASVDLIFAPAYGSNKKNATDIRMAIDAVELVFIRPEIGTYILLTGDSDFSSLVLKLKEYGKYVIGVGIQESSSDILVQNCDEYYSYTSLTGLTKTTELASNQRDPWVLVKDAVAKMVSRGDVMRSDRLKQVMQELDPAFDEGSLGFSKFSKFLAEASSRGLLTLRKLENGQYEVDAGKGRARGADEGRGRRERGRGRRDRRERQPSRVGTSNGDEPQVVETEGSVDAPSGDPLQGAYAVLTEALESLRDGGRDPVRDSDVKRKILERSPNFDETELGFPKFSKFLAQAVDHGVIRTLRTESGNLQVSLIDAETAGDGRSGPTSAEGRTDEPDHARYDEPVGSRYDEPVEGRDDEPDAGPYDAEGPTWERPREAPSRAPDTPAREEVVETAAVPRHEREEAAPSGPMVIDVEPPRSGRGLGPRRGSTRRRGADDPPPLFEGQVAAAPAAQGGQLREMASHGTHPEEAPELALAPTGRAMPAASTAPAVSDDAMEALEGLGLPTDSGAMVRYLTHRYKGVGAKTAETLVERFGAGLFATMHTNPDAILAAVPSHRGEQVLDAWRSDYARRTGADDTRGGGR